MFLLPQGLTVTGVNTWALSVIREIRRRGAARRLGWESAEAGAAFSDAAEAAYLALA